jgi:hypothetical protein
MAKLLTAFADFAVLPKYPIHRADRTVIRSLIEQAGVDFCRRLIREAWRVQQIQHLLLLRDA